MISCVDPLTYSNRFINYIISLTDVKQFLSNEIKEAPQEDEEYEYLFDDDDDSEEEDSIFKKIKKVSSSMENKQNENNNALLFPIDVSPEGIQTYSGYKVDLKTD